MQLKYFKDDFKGERLSTKYTIQLFTYLGF